MKIAKYHKWVFLTLCLMVSGTPVSPLFGTDVDSSSAGISINAENETLTNVFTKISQASGYEIEFNQAWGDHPVNVNFSNETLENALSRVLANLNHALIWNESEKKISIFINGSVSARGSGSSRPAGGSSAPSRGAEVYRRPVAGSSVRTPSRRSNEVGDTSQPSSVRQSRQPTRRTDRDPPVSVSGGDTRFEQGTSTID
jgi:hypothetical protein